MPTGCLPCDVDEFWYAPGRTIAEALDGCPHSKLEVEHWYHRDWDHRYTAPTESLVAFRAYPGPSVGMGQHHSTTPEGGPGQPGVLYSRELQFRGYEHFRSKGMDRIQSFREEIQAREASGGGPLTHWLLTTYGQVGVPEEQVKAYWEDSRDEWPHHNRPSVYDPIPSRTSARPRAWSMAA